MRRIVFVFAIVSAACAHMAPPGLTAQASGPQDSPAAPSATAPSKAPTEEGWSWDARAEGPAPEALPAVRRDTPSGMPVPRFVSLKSAKTFCRIGPSFSHPVRITYMREGLPLVVVAETRDHWRKLRDRDGDECWAHRSKLSGVDTALVIEDGLVLRARPSESAPARARLGEGVIAHIDGAEEGWIKVSANNTRGWVRGTGLWGASASDAFAAAHN